MVRSFIQVIQSVISEAENKIAKEEEFSVRTVRRVIRENLSLNRHKRIRPLTTHHVQQRSPIWIGSEKSS